MLWFTEEKTWNDSLWEIEGSSKARLVQATPNIDKTCGYVARVSSKNQENPKVKGLLRYCANEGHWSVFEQGSLTIEVVTPLAIAIQLIRHRSFCYQQFSGRYQDQTAMGDVTDGLPAAAKMFYLPTVGRLQDNKNRQNSIVSEDGLFTDRMVAIMEEAYICAHKAYANLIDMGVAKEVARFVLPEGVYTRLYMTGSPRSFIHYLAVRDDEGVAQWEHVELARAIGRVFMGECPVISSAVFGDE